MPRPQGHRYHHGSIHGPWAQQLDMNEPRDDEVIQYILNMTGFLDIQKINDYSAVFITQRGAYSIGGVLCGSVPAWQLLSA